MLKGFSRRFTEPDNADIAAWERQLSHFLVNSAAMSKHFQRIIHVQSEAGKEYGKRSGRLASRSLYKIPAGGQEVFYQRLAPRITKNCAITILADASGSMHGTKFHAASAACILLNEALTKVGIPFEILMFSETGVPRLPLLMVLKSFAEKVSKDDLLRYTCIANNYLGDNPDGEALLWAYSRLRVRNEKRKVMIVLSDGQPCTNASGDAAYHLKEVVKEMQKRIDVVGIGLMSTSVKEFYSEYAVVTSAEDLDKAFITTLRNKIV